MDSENKTDHRPQTTDHRQIIFYITNNGLNLAQRLKEFFPDSEMVRFNTAVFADKWTTSKNIICIMATGIAVRAVAPLLKDKRTDPAVVVLDEKGSFVISLLSGHIGGANMLAQKISGFLGAQAIITTASDVQGKLALDVWASGNNLYVEDFERLKGLSAKIVNNRKIKVHSDYPLSTEKMPEEFTIVNSPDQADIIISNGIMDQDALFLRPKNLFAGIGCNRGTAKEEIKKTLDAILQREKLSAGSISSVCTIDLKKDEKGLLEFARDNGLTIEFFSKDDLNNAVFTYNIAESEAVKAATGAKAVAEPAAVLGAKKMQSDCAIIVRKEKRGNVTLAIAKAEFTL